MPKIIIPLLMFLLQIIMLSNFEQWKSFLFFRIESNLHGVMAFCIKHYKQL